MARKSSTQLNYSRIFITLLVIAGLGGGFIYLLSSKQDTVVAASSDFPIDDYMSRSSSLRDNVYTISGKVENREVHSKGEIITLVIEVGKGKTERLPVVIPRQKISSNIEREQSYTFRVKVSSMGQARGLLVAESVSNA